MNKLDSKILSKINHNVKFNASILGNNNILIHSDIKNLFLFDFESKKDYLSKHLNNIYDIFSEFNIWMPTFNYDFTKSGVYNVKEDRSQIFLVR